MATEASTSFVTRIAELASEPGPRADLRSGLGRTVDQASRVHRYVAPWTGSCGPHQKAVYYAVASLIAHRPEDAVTAAWAGNLGTSIARCHNLAMSTRETSVHLLSRQPASTFCRMLTRIVLPLRTAATPVDFATLLHHGSRWPSSRQSISSSWLQSFYREVDGGTDVEYDTESDDQPL
ncbi:type I-E CRISPR-associated protein Cse2/CasB [Actinosynnema sp. NPDC050436]|uniref:type I-E CRISPR-associated protein Cse2/CasB n=1 Tax=Actinosynnema sp. NPDC050436 TaxID=3155659 RepID=UPI003406F4BE